MSFLERLWLRISPTIESIELGSPAGGRSPRGSSVSVGPTIGEAARPSIPPEVKLDGETQPFGGQSGTGSKWSEVAKWLFNDIPYIAMLLLAVVGILLRLPVMYWIILTPIFGLITIGEGWRHFDTRGERLGLTYRVAAIWCALLLAIYLLYNGGVQGIMNANATSLTMITLLALGTFVAGVQAHVWQICAVGAVLFLAVPGVGWLDQSPLLLAAVACVVVACGGLLWWFRESQ